MGCHNHLPFTTFQSIGSIIHVTLEIIVLSVLQCKQHLDENLMPLNLHSSSVLGLLKIDFFISTGLRCYLSYLGDYSYLFSSVNNTYASYPQCLKKFMLLTLHFSSVLGLWKIGFFTSAGISPYQLPGEQLTSICLSQWQKSFRKETLLMSSSSLQKVQAICHKRIGKSIHSNFTIS